MFSIIMPCDTNRIHQLCKTLEAYANYGVPEGTEFLLISRTITELPYIPQGLNVRLINYTHTTGFNPSKALNIGVREAVNDRIIITSPEVKPITNVLNDLQFYPTQNVVCQVFDQNENGSISMSLVNSRFRTQHPGYYFLALFQKKDIQTINGWDEMFMLGYAWEDDDFGHRWLRAKIPFTVADHIQGLHQYHPRSETITGGWVTNKVTLDRNDVKGIIRPKLGLKVGECDEHN